MLAVDIHFSRVDGGVSIPLAGHEASSIALSAQLDVVRSSCADGQVFPATERGYAVVEVGQGALVLLAIEESSTAEAVRSLLRQEKRTTRPYKATSHPKAKSWQCSRPFIITTVHYYQTVPCRAEEVGSRAGLCCSATLCHDAWRRSWRIFGRGPRLQPHSSAPHRVTVSL